MAKKLGRNDLCWCGSGLKYKKCHSDREKQEPLKPWEVDNTIRKASSIGECLVPKPMKAICSKTIVKAHTVPRASLQKIACDGHVYSFIPNVQNMGRYEGKLQPQLVGINRSSTFTGFCSAHDNNIFSKTESKPFKASQEQCFLLAYLALARELYMKSLQVSLSNDRRQADRGRPLEQQFAIQSKNSWFDTGSAAGLNDSKYHKEMYDNILLSCNFSSVRGYVIELDSPPPIMCSGGTFPEQDFEGNQLQDLYDLTVTPHLLTVTSFHGGQYGVILFSWLLDSDTTCRKFIDSLKELPPDRMTDGIIRFLFQFCENIHISPDWWENLGDKKRDTLINRAATSMNPYIDRKPNCISEDGIRFDNWSISNLTTIGF